MTSLLRRCAASCAARPLVVVVAWLAAAAVAVVLAATVGGSLTPQKTLPGTPIAAAEARLDAHFPAADVESAEVVLHARSAQRLAAAVTRASAAIGRLPHVVPADSATRWSADRRTALVHVSYDVRRFTLGSGALAALRGAARQGGVDAYVTGALAFDASSPGPGAGEKLGVALALLVLVFAFGSVFAALLPVAIAAISIVTGLSLVRFLALAYGVSSSAPALATMIGLGVGIDYALFVVSRHREALRSGVPARTAAVMATATAGTSVLWAGITVVAAICGLAFAGIPLITSLGFAAAIVVAVSVVAALTLLPALLTLLGPRVDRWHVPLPHLRRHLGATDARSGELGWARWAAHIERRPWRYALGAAGLLVVLALPVAGLRLGYPDGSAAPAGSSDHRSYELITTAFGVGANGTVNIVLAAPPGGSPVPAGRAVAAAARRDRDVFAVGRLQVSPDGTTAVLPVQQRSAPQAAASDALVVRLRSQLLPGIERRTGTTMWVTGVSAGHHDVSQRMLARLPWFIGAVLTVSFLLLMLVFRSVLVPIKAVLLNLLSIAAALGVVTAVFSWGWLRQLVGVPETVPVVDVVPMLLFAIVFGLSMDYEVFLLSRVREEWLLGGDGRGSVARGLTSTARVISAAAAIMVAVFCSFTLSSDVIVKMMGLGLAVGVFLDASVIRLVLVPATMTLLGDMNWWLPRWLDRAIPHIEIDAAVPVSPPPLDAAAAVHTG